MSGFRFFFVFLPRLFGKIGEYMKQSKKLYNHETERNSFRQL